MSTVGEPQDAVPDEGTMQLRPEPQDAVPPAEAGTVRLGRGPVPGQAADPDVIPTVRFGADPDVVPTVRLGADPDVVPTVRLGADPDVVPTVRLASDPDVVPTVRLPAGSEAPAPTPTLMLPVEPEAPAAAPVPAPTPTLQMTVGAAPAPAPAPEAPAAVPDPGLIRFGPGVPDPKTARTIAVWKGEVAPEPEAEERRKRGWLFWVPVALVFLALLAWWLYGLLAPAQLKLTAASVQVSPAAVSCGGKATITATVTTDGSGGSFHYRWLRSDGTDSGWLTETVAAGTRSVQLPLIWSLSGPGTFAGRATLEIEGHPALTGSGLFAYSCAG